VSLGAVRLLSFDFTAGEGNSEWHRTPPPGPCPRSRRLRRRHSGSNTRADQCGYFLLQPRQTPACRAQPRRRSAPASPASPPRRHKLRAFSLGSRYPTLLLAAAEEKSRVSRFREVFQHAYDHIANPDCRPTASMRGSDTRRQPGANTLAQGIPGGGQQPADSPTPPVAPLVIQAARLKPALRLPLPPWMSRTDRE